MGLQPLVFWWAKVEVLGALPLPPGGRFFPTRSRVTSLQLSLRGCQLFSLCLSR